MTTLHEKAEIARTIVARSRSMRGVMSTPWRGIIAGVGPAGFEIRRVDTAAVPAFRAAREAPRPHGDRDRIAALNSDTRSSAA